MTLCRWANSSQLFEGLQCLRHQRQRSSQGPEVPTETTAKGLVSSDVRPLECVVLLKTDHLFGRRKQEWRGRRYHNNEEVKTDIHKCLRKQKARDDKTSKERQCTLRLC